MNRNQRLRILKLSQSPAPAGAAATAVTPAVQATVPPNAPQRIDIRTVPGFNTNLFAVSPSVITNIEDIANIINKNLSILSNGKITFAFAWTNPSVTGSEFVNSVKNLMNLAKWIYNVVRSRAQAYSMEGLRAIATGLITTVSSYDFPEDNAATVKSDLVAAANVMLAKLGTASSVPR